MNTAIDNRIEQQVKQTTKKIKEIRINLENLWISNVQVKEVLQVINSMMLRNSITQNNKQERIYNTSMCVEQFKEANRDKLDECYAEDNPEKRLSSWSHQRSDEYMEYINLAAIETMIELYERHISE